MPTPHAGATSTVVYLTPELRKAAVREAVTDYRKAASRLRRMANPTTRARRTPTEAVALATACTDRMDTALQALLALDQHPLVSLLADEYRLASRCDAIRRNNNGTHISIRPPSEDLARLKHARAALDQALENL